MRALITQLRNGSPDDPDSEWKAAIELGDIDDETEKGLVVDVLIGILAFDTAHALTRAHAVEALGKLNDPRATQALLRALDDDYRLVRAYAASSIGMIASSLEALERLIVAMNNDDFYGVRAEAVGALTQITLRVDDDTLRSRIRDAFESLRTAEQEQPKAGSIRVIAEVERALSVL